MFTVDEYIASIQAHLEKHSNVLMDKLTEVVSYNFSPAIELLDFSAFIDSPRFEISIMLFSMNRDANEVFADDNETAVFAGSVNVLQDAPYYQLDDKLRDEFFDFYEQDVEQITEKEQKVFMTWFSNCWDQADGQACPLPVYFGLHDETRSYDLMKKEIVEDDEKWS